jgi:hypothetical protein
MERAEGVPKTTIDPQFTPVTYTREQHLCPLHRGGCGAVRLINVLSVTELTEVERLSTPGARPNPNPKPACGRPGGHHTVPPARGRFDEDCTSFCAHCADTRWVCEAHPDRPWEDSPRSCYCGAPGEPCPICNVPEDGATPVLPEGFRVDMDDKGWRH